MEDAYVNGKFNLGHIYKRYFTFFLAIQAVFSFEVSQKCIKELNKYFFKYHKTEEFHACIPRLTVIYLLGTVLG